MTEILSAVAIDKSFSPSRDVQPDDQVFVLSSSQLQTIIREATAPLLARIEALEIRYNAQGCDDDIQPIQDTDPTHPDGFTAILEGHLERITILEERMARELLEDRKRISILEHVQVPVHVGRRSQQRIAQLKEILKRNRGVLAFAEIRRHLGLSMSQLSQLIRKLDKRIFEVRWRRTDPTARREKILVLRERLRDPILM